MSGIFPEIIDISRCVNVNQMIQFRPKTDTIPILKGRVMVFMFARLLLARLVDQVIHHSKMSIIIYVNQHF